MNIHVRPRAEDPNVSMRLIEKIKHKCQDYFRETPETLSDSFVSDLKNDIFHFKKDCLVAVELAQQFIEKTLETTPKITSKTEILKLECEVERLTQSNQELKKELETRTETKKELSEEFLNNLPESSTSDESEKLISELQAQLVIQELKYENSIGDLETSNQALKIKNKQLETVLGETEKKVEMLEKKVKDSLSGYSKFLLRKTADNKETQTFGGAVMSIEIGTGLEVQRSNEFMSQISRLSITESEIFDVTSMQVCDIHHQNDISVFSVKGQRGELRLQRFEPVNFCRELEVERFSLGTYPVFNCENFECFSENSVKEGNREISEKITPTERPSFQVVLVNSIFIIPEAVEKFEAKNLNLVHMENYSINPLKPVQCKFFSISSFSESIPCSPKPNKPTLSCQSIFSYKTSLSPTVLPLIFTLSSQPSLSLSLFTKKVIQSTLDQSICESFSILPTVPSVPTLSEESKSRSSKRRGSQLTDRKPAIEEYFSLVTLTQTFQAAKMKLGQQTKNLSQEDLYQKASKENIPFFEWNDWVTLQLKP